MLPLTSARLGLRLAVQRPIAHTAPQQLVPSPIPKRCLTTTSLQTARTKSPSCSKHAAIRPRRYASSTAQSANPTISAAAGQRSAAASSAALDWNSFFRLRTSRRHYSLSSSLIGLIVSATGTAYFLVEFPDQSEYVVKLIPMDPIISTGIAVSVAMLAGWLLGPVLGNGLWRLLYRKRMPEFTIKERAFFERIKTHRVNPSGASTNNPVPDFYGEKVGSVSGYRRWLKDQRAFNRKRGGNYGAGI